MANSEAMFEMAQGMAKRILTEAPGDDSLAKRERAKLAFYLCFARAADDAEIESLIARRHQAKLEKDYALADEIRQTLGDAGIVLEDSREGTSWRRS